jgi:Ser/Thr protein kinase RdoA (MazF antagonist)
MARAWVDVQAEWAGRAQELLAAGLPDRRTPALLDAVLATVRRADARAELAPAELAALDRLADGLPGRLHELDACGLPPTLVHGDLHPGNWRGPGDDLVLLDWGDSGVGHPLLDLPAFLSRVPDAGRRTVLAAWADAWRERVPGADVDRAVELVAPVAELVRAVVYRTFLDGVEESERTYHDGDVAVALRSALAVARTGPDGHP